MRRGNDVVLYVEDHGDFVATAGAIGTIEVFGEGGARTAEVTAAGGNTLVATGAQFASGDRIRVRAMLPTDLLANYDRISNRRNRIRDHLDGWPRPIGFKIALCHLSRFAELTGRSPLHAGSNASC